MPVPFFGGRLDVALVEKLAWRALQNLDPNHPHFRELNLSNAWRCDDEVWPIDDEATQLIFDRAARLLDAKGEHDSCARTQYAVNLLAIFGAATAGAPYCLALLRSLATPARFDTAEQRKAALAFREIFDFLSVQTRGGCWQPGYKPVRCGDSIPAEQD